MGSAREIGPEHLALVVEALLEGVRRGELQATAEDVAFLESVARRLREPAAV